MSDLDKGTPRFIPMPGRVAVRLHSEDRVGSLIIPPQYQKSRVMGTIIALGDDESEGEDWDLTVGELVLFGMNAGIQVQVGRESVLLLRTSEILCKVLFEGDKPAGLQAGEVLGPDDED